MYELEDTVLLLATILADEIEFLENALFGKKAESLEVSWRDRVRSFNFDGKFLADQKIYFMALSRTPESKFGKVFSTVREIGAQFHPDKMFKAFAIES